MRVEIVKVGNGYVLKVEKDGGVFGLSGGEPEKLVFTSKDQLIAGLARRVE
jgi:hypothetical protein